MGLRRIASLAFALPLVAASLAPAAMAADHADGPATTADPTADITDVYAWVSGGKTYLVMDIGKNLPAGAKFSNTVKYVFHTVSESAYGATVKTPLNIICTFTVAQVASCWAGDKDYVTGDASKTTGLSSADGKLKVFAGLRADPFFFNLKGFKDVAATVHAAAPHLSFTSGGCPNLDPKTSALLVGQLSTSTPDAGNAAVDNFAGFNVLSIVLELDTPLVAAGGPIVGVWGSTNK
jgi:hypothetical protein